MRRTSTPLSRALNARPTFLGVARGLALAECTISFYLLVLLGLKNYVAWGLVGVWWMLAHPVLRRAFSNDRLVLHTFFRSLSRKRYYPCWPRLDTVPPRARPSIRRRTPGA